MISLNQLIKNTLPSVPFLKSDYQFVTLTFEKSLVGTIDILGNPTGSELFGVLAHLYITTSLESFASPNSGQQNRVYKGHAQQPKILPLWIVPGVGGSCLLGDRTYDFILLSLDRTSMPAYSENFGERLELNMFSSSKSL